jgi:signal transduction histidine kinase
MRRTPAVRSVGAMRENEAAENFALPGPPGAVRGFFRNRPWIARASVVAGYASVALILAVISAIPPLRTPWWFSALLIVAGCALLLVRRSPLGAFVGALALLLVSVAGGTGAEAIVAVITLYRVGVHHSAVVAWLCFAGAAVGGGIGAALLVARARGGFRLWEPTQPPITSDPFSDWLNAALLIVVPLLIAALFGANAGQRRRYVAALIDRASQLARERDQQAEIAAAGERERISREMHDVIAHSLSVIIALTEGANAAAPDQPEQARDAVSRAAETGRRTLNEVRRLLGPVHGDERDQPAGHAPQPNESDLPELAEEFRRAGLPVRLSTTGAPPNDPVLGLTVYRIVQESLTNALRHARGVRDVGVTVTWAQGEVTVLTEDSALASVVSMNPGRGILGMKERVALYEGEVEAGPRENGGWRVFARLQWEKQT